MGFVCDTSSVTEEIAAVTNCLNEYQKIVDTGVVYEEQYEEFINKLHSVGADKILECYQQQLQPGWKKISRGVSDNEYIFYSNGTNDGTTCPVL